MEEPRIESYIQDFLSGFDESRFPADFLSDYEAVECFGHSEHCETLLVKRRETGAHAIAKCYDAQWPGGRSEGELLKKLKHPALPALLEVYENENMLCVVRDYIPGVTLSKAAADAPLSQERVIDIGLQLCDVLSYLHEQTPPIIHRDVKPENVILREDGSAALIDFGISREFDKDAKNDTQRLGTACFAPPEQYGFAQTDCRSDIFSLGMVLGFLLTNRAEPAELESGISDRALGRIIQKCVAFAPKDRYANVAQLKRALAAQRLPARRKRRLWAGVLGAALLIVAALAVTRLAREKKQSVWNGDSSVPAYGSEEVIAGQAADYLNEKYQTELFTDSAEAADVGYIRALLTKVYGYDEAYVNARPSAMPPTEVEDSFLPWALEDGETVSLDTMAYIAVKIYWPEGAADWSSLQDDTGEYPGVRVARAFAEENGLYGFVNKADAVSIADAAVLLYNADRAYGEGLPPQLMSAYMPKAKPVSALGFTEPLMEQAVRAVLGKSETDAVSPEELALVEGLYIFGGAVSPDQDGFYASAGDWYASGHGVKGGVSSLADVMLLPNLRALCIAAQDIDDLSPLSTLKNLEKIEMKHNRISDITVLAALPALASVGLNDNPVQDLSALGDCKNLRFLDLCDVQDYDPSFLDQLGDFEFLDIANRTDSFAHLGSRRVRELKLGYSELDSLAYLAELNGLQSLELKHSKLSDLSGIEAHAALQYLNIAGCAVSDLSPVLQLSALKTLVLSEDMRPALEALGNVPFEVSFE